MRCVITGSSGLLGKYLLKTQPKKQFEGMALEPEHEIIAATRQSLDLSNPIAQLFKIMPDLIIHCAANGDVDSVEANSVEAVRSDLEGTINLMEYCEKMNCKLITISTNAVYDGDNPPYSELSKRNPINFYGKIKSLADDIIEKSLCDWIIVRPIFLFGWGDVRDNWATKIIRELKAGNKLKLVTDSYTQPTYAGVVAATIWQFIKADNWQQSRNIAGINKLSVFDFGLLVAEVFELDSSLIRRAQLEDFKSIAPRPIDTTFSDECLVNQTTKDGLIEMRKEMEGNLKSIKYIMPTIKTSL